MKAKFKIKRTEWTLDSKSKRVNDFLHRPAIDPGAESVARKILDEIRKDGDKAVLKYAAKFDTPGITSFKVTAEEIETAKKAVDPAFRKAAREADRRIKRFSKAGLRKDWKMKTPCGGSLGEQFMPLDRVGVYIPGGTAPLASTSLMTASIAAAAGVPEIVACTPADKNGVVNPYVIYSLVLAGVSEIYKMGGVQAIGALAYGTATVRKVQKIVGPGNAYVAAAKKLVYGDVALDSIAGPSEVAILADSSVPASYIAADLLAQAEHGTGDEKALLVTTSATLANKVEAEIWRQTDNLSRKSLTLKVLKTGLLIVKVKNLEQGMELINRFAPEHFELLVKDPDKWVKKVRAAGAIFVGPWTPESAGDFAAGPSHVLPTGGAAAMFSGLTVDDFRRRSSVIKLSERDLKEMLPIIEAFGRVEGLDGHVKSAQVRFGRV